MKQQIQNINTNISSIAFAMESICCVAKMNKMMMCCCMMKNRIPWQML